MLELDVNQKKAVEAVDGPVMIVSCAGSGKTTVILEKVNEIIKRNVDPNRILAVTFSKAAAEEMKMRYSENYDHNGVTFSTIHAIGFGILRSYSGISRDAVLQSRESSQFKYDSFQKYIMKNKRFKSLDYDEYSKEIDLYISQKMFNEYLNIEDNKRRNITYENIFRDYKEFKRKLDKIDFDDMIIQCHQLLKSNPQLLEDLQGGYDYYLIDEFQDTNIIQAEIFYMLSSRTNNICVVGDDDQSIYAFRGADSFIFKDFMKRYPTTEVIYLNTNYRSLPYIVEGASKVIVNNNDRIDKEFLVNREGPGEISVQSEVSSSKEITRLVEKIKEQHANGVAYKDIGILYRINSTATLLVAILEKENIPYYTARLPKDLHSGFVFKDILAYHSLAQGHGDLEDLMRISNRPNRYINRKKLSASHSLTEKDVLRALIRGEKEQFKVESMKKNVRQLFRNLSKLKDLKPIQFMEYLQFKMYYVHALDDTASFLNKQENPWKSEFKILKEESKNFETFDDWMSAIAENRKQRIELLEENKEKGVYLSTFHGAKGLQWEHVYLIAANENITPHAKAIDLEKDRDMTGIEEERRLFYVAMTRAMNKLSISYNSDEKFSRPSRFIKEM